MTVHLDGSQSSYFRQARDSVHIYGTLLKFDGTSLVGFALDTMLLALTALSTGLPVAVLLTVRR